MHTNKVIGGILLMAGTCIGAGMLALPVSTAPAGFYLSILLLTSCWALMYLTGLCVLEVNLWLDGEPSFVTMARRTLGKWGGYVTWVLFLFLLYSLIAAYISGGGDIISSALHSLNIKTITPHTCIFIWTSLFSLVIFLGVSFTDYINRILMLGLIIAYALLMTIATPNVNITLLSNGHSRYMLAAMPVLFSALAFHIIIPTLRTYLSSDVKKLRKIILLGSLLPLLIYIAWEFIIFGTLPLHGENGLVSILQSGHAISKLTDSLEVVTQHPLFSTGARFFAFFAIASSFLGVSYGLFDLMSDALKIKKNFLGRVLCVCITFIPPLIFALSYPRGFILALSYAGICIALIHGVLPVMMVWVGRYHRHFKGPYKLPGGKGVLVFLLLCFSFVVFADVATWMGWIPSLV